MIKTTTLSRLVSSKRTVAAAALLASASAFAGVQGDIGFGTTMSHGASNVDKNAPVLDVDLGWREGNVALQGVAIGQVNVRDFDLDRPGAPYGFDSFYGGQVVGYLPIVPLFEAYGGVGVGRTRLSDGVRGDPALHRTDGLLSAGVQFHALGLFTLGGGVDYVTQTHVSMASVRFQLGF